MFSSRVPTHHENNTRFSVVHVAGISLHGTRLFDLASVNRYTVGVAVEKSKNPITELYNCQATNCTRLPFSL